MKAIKVIMWIMLPIVLFIVIFGFMHLRDRNPGYRLDEYIDIPQTDQLTIGFAKRSITPAVPDFWRDVNDDGHFSQEDGDYYEDGNRNDLFDAVYIAGFQNNRPAAGIHDSLWARASVWTIDTFTLGMVVLDAIGFMHDDVVQVRERVQAAVDIDYLIVSATHTHEAPDLIGIWGPSDYTSGVDPAYRELVINQTAQSAIQAFHNRQPAFLEIAQDLSSANTLVQDTREPYIMDVGLRIINCVSKRTGESIGSIVNWANHPETLWNRNYQITSDFPHYLRQGIEQGVSLPDTLLPGLGGVCLFLNGPIGGLMTTSPRFGVENLAQDSVYMEPSFEKAHAQGMHLAKIGLEALQNAESVVAGAFSCRYRTLHLPLQNKLFRLGAFLGVLERGLSGWITVRSELAIWNFGPLSFLHIPGELYPEIALGGVENPAGADFEMSPIESQPLIELMPGNIKCIIGLSNDMIGYIIPKSEWDVKPPYLYDAESSPYGEINSLGPVTSERIYQALTEMIDETW